MKIFSGTLIFLLIAAPWFIWVSMVNNEFAHFFFIQEHFQRFTTKMHGRYQPMWYFLPILAFGLLPWLLPAFLTLRGIFARKPGGEFDAKFFLVLWIVVVFVFFSVSGSKLPSYILPMFPALALLIGRRLAVAQPRRLLAVQAGLAAATGIAVAAFSSRIPVGADYVCWIVTAAVLLVLASVGAGLAAYRGKPALAVALIAAGSFAGTLTALVSHRTLAPAHSIASQAGAVPRNVPVFAVDFYDHTLPWYLRRTVTMVSYKDELDAAIAWEPQKFIPDLTAFARAWAAAPSAYAVFSSRSFEAIQKETGIPAEVVSRGPRYTIVRKP
jgi:4-amino-4-deoxy-L-arabinose transferase-like glycosyltransferase